MNKLPYLIAFIFIVFFINACSSHTEINRSFDPISYMPIEGKNCNMYFEGTPPSNASYKVYWDGKCKNGFADGLGRELSNRGVEFIALYDDKLPYYVYSKHDIDEFKIGNVLDNGDFIGIQFNKYNSNHQITYNKDGKYFILDTNAIGRCNMLFTQSKGQCITKNNIKDKNIITNEVKDALKIAMNEYGKALKIVNQYKDRICSMKSLDNEAYNVMINAYKKYNLYDASYFSICNQNMDYRTNKPQYIIDFLESL